MTRPSPIAAVTLAALTTLGVIAPAAQAQRAKGIDVSYHQGTINWSSVAASGVQFAFIRSSYGENSSDTQFTANIAGANANGVLAGAYHYTYPSIAGNDGATEATNFWNRGKTAMRAGNLRPVVDVEELSVNGNLTDWVLAFSDKLYALSGVRPLIYANSNYARNYLDSRVTGHDLWLANYGGGSITPTQAQTMTPPGTNPTGVWGASNAWDFWQYTSSGSVAGISGGVDLDVANGDINFVKQFQIPAIYMVDASGAWGTSANWNTGTGLPTANDRVIINRSAASPVVTVSVNPRVGRSLELGDQLAVTSGSLAITEYATLNGNTSVSGGAFSAGTISNTATLAVSGGTLTTASLANAGTLSLSGGTTTINGAITGVGTTNASGGSLTATSITQNGLALAGTGRVTLSSTNVSVVKSLSVASTALLDVNRAKLIVDYTGATPIDAFRTAALAGAIDSSAASASTGVGYVEATKLFGSFTASTKWNNVVVDATSLLVSLALFGDTDLNGTVNFADLSTLNANWLKAGLWQQADSTYDGFVDAADLALLGLNYGKTLNPDGTITGGDPSGFLVAVNQFPNLVPEPAALAAAAALGAALIGRRRQSC